MSERRDPVLKEMDQIENQIVADKYVTALKKVQFMNELKNGLGKEIKANPRAVKIITKPWYVKLKEKAKKIFTRL
jgi:hypothetical protein